MADDMHIYPYHNESDESFTYRVCYSALGQWCLNMGNNRNGDEVGTTKHHQTIVLNELVFQYLILFPFISERLVSINDNNGGVSVFIRRVYEETGYLLTDEDNHNRIANFGRTLKIGNETLFFGLSNNNQVINGLGVFSTPTTYIVDLKDFLIRDNLTVDEYFKVHFDPIDFYERDIDTQELEFFNPLSNNVPSKSWNSRFETECSVARKSEIGPYYRVMKTDNGIVFADEPIKTQSDDFTSYEYRRLYFAIKRHYGNPVKIFVLKLDEHYSKIRVEGHLPNREYYFLLLLSWPQHSVFDRVNFIIKNSLLSDVLVILEDIGLEIKGG